jgi:PEP-CTERM motif-containing protein
MKSIVAYAASAVHAASFSCFTLVAVGVLCCGIATTSFAQNGTQSDLVAVIDPGGVTFFFPVPENDPNNQLLAAFYGPINAPNQWIQFNQEGPGPIVVSDRLSVRNQHLYFESDPLGPLFPDLPPNPNAVLTETGGLQRVDQFLQPNAGFQIPPIFVQSDLNIPIPEPSSFVLLGIGVAALCGRAVWRRRRTAA